MAEKKSLIKNYIFNFAKTLSSLLFPLVSFTYSARVLGVEGIGKVNFSKSVISYFTLIAGLGMNYYGTREAAKLRDDRVKLSRFVREMLLINGISTLFAYSLLVLAMVVIRKLQAYDSLLIVCSFSIVMQGLGMEWLFQGLEEYRYIAVRSMFFQGISLMLLPVLVREKRDVFLYAVITVFASSGPYLLNFLHAKKYIDLHIFGHYEIKKHLKPLLWLFAMALSIELYTVLDSSMLGFLWNDTAVGNYSAAIKVNKLTNQLIVALGVVLIPRLSYYVGLQAHSKINRLVVQAYNYVFMLSVPAAIGLYMLSDELIRLLSGAEFASAGLTMRILTPIVIVIPFSVITNQQTFIPMGKENLILISTCTGAVSNFLCNLVLIPRYAENGAAVGTVVAESIVAIVCFFNLRRYFNVKDVFRHYLQYWLAALPIPVIAILFRHIPVPEIIRVCCVILLSCCGYFIMLYLQKNIYLLQAVNVVKERIRH